ncbi:MAG TPA: carbamoyltransferase C-terminal domain-containing protein, partial [Puia sp.]|nr:carbamoyltransferase C-terminal domain-containing protein [Puia sp.]
VSAMAGEAKRLTGSDRLCMAGGVALNAVANGKLHGSGLFSRIFIQPAAGDAGGALGAALAAYYIYADQPRRVSSEHMDGQKGSLLGTEFSDAYVEALIKETGAVAHYYGDESGLLKRSASLLAEGNVIGWHQGRMEFGPRALGSRSILADARSPEMQKKLNLKIKNRESFRPFAPVVLSEEAADYFELEIGEPSPYMLLVKKVRSSRCLPFPEGYGSWNLMDKLYFQRSDIPAVTHVDYSARVQTVHRAVNPRLWSLLQEFRKLTGYGVLVNTSFNVRDEPIVNSPEDAWRCFMNTEMDYLVMGNYMLAKKDQAGHAGAVAGRDWGGEIGGSAAGQVSAK